MNKCVNISHPEFKELQEATGLNSFKLEVQVYKWREANNIDRFPSVDEVSNEAKVNAELKLVDTLLDLDLDKKTIRRSTKSRPNLDKNIRKTLAGKGVPKAQIDLLFDYMDDNNIDKISTKDLALQIAVDYSYTVEIKTATQKLPKGVTEEEYAYALHQEFGVDEHDSITAPEATEETPTQHYSSLTVPGGTNYTENEIATPAITPSIKGHAQFATDKGIGWFRSDDKIKAETLKSISAREYFDNLPDNTNEFVSLFHAKVDGKWYIVPEDYNKEWTTKEEMSLISDEEAFNNLQNGFVNESIQEKFTGESSKTRRILEVQSDLFQKGRDKNNLITPQDESFLLPKSKFTVISKDEYNKAVNGGKIVSGVGTEEFGYSATYEYNNKLYTQIDENEFGYLNKAKDDISGENQFLQLLNKDNNWVTFFVKSIIQDSAKKGYEKVLFPTGDTASKIEGHSTLEEFKKQKEDRIKELEKEINKDLEVQKKVNKKAIELQEKMILASEKESDKNIHRRKIEELKKEEFKPLSKKENEIKTLKQELERIETEGFGALKPIWNFYENTVTNTLKKQFGKSNIKKITDEHGNSWTQLEIAPSMASDKILFQLPKSNKQSPQIKEGVPELFESNPELANAVYEAAGFINVITPSDKIVFGHPTIGKSFLKNKGENKFISLDDDYATEINSKVKEIADKYDVTTYQVKDGGTQRWNNEYNQMMQEMFEVAKQKAISENKTLFTSNTNLLRNNAESFDKVINLTDKEFERRVQKRGAKYDTKEWKSQINDAVSKIPSNKVIPTDKYLSDLFITPQQKQQAQQLYSQYLDIIFPDSKVKDIVYHVGYNIIEKFTKRENGIYFTDNVKYAENLIIEKIKSDALYSGVQMNTEEARKELKKYTVLLNSQNIKEIPKVNSKIVKNLNKDNFDTIKGVEDKSQNVESYVVFEPEQIHILGSKQDIEGFKQFINEKNTYFQQSSKTSELTPEEIQQHKEEKEKAVSKKKLNDLEDKLTTWLASLGVNVEVSDRIKERYGVNAIGVADMLRNAVVLAKGKADVNTLAEEVAHIAVEALGTDHSAISKAMELIEDTEKYKQVVEEYSEVYKGDATKLKKEAVGQLLQEVIMEKNESSLEGEPKGIIARLKRLLNTIFKVFKKKFSKAEVKDIDTAIKNSLGDVALDILNNSTERFDITKLSEGSELFALTNEFNSENYKSKMLMKKHTKALESAIKKTMNKIEELQVKGRIGGKIELNKLKARMEAAIVNTDVAYGAAIYAEEIGNVIEEQYNHLENIIDTLEENNTVYNARKLLNITTEIKEYIEPKKEVIDDLIGDIKKARRDLKKQPENDERKAALDLIDALLDRFEWIDNTANSALRIGNDIAYEAYKDEILDIALKRFEADKRSKKGDLKDMSQKEFEEHLLQALKTGKSEIPTITAYLSAITHTTDDLAGIVGMKVKKELARANMEAQELAYEIIDVADEAKKVGLDGEKLMEKDENGVPTGYVLGATNRAAYEKALYETRKNTAKEFFFPENHRERKGLLEHQIPARAAKWYNDNKDNKDFIAKAEAAKKSRKFKQLKNEQNFTDNVALVETFKHMRNVKLRKFYEKHQSNKSKQEINKISERAKQDYINEYVTEPENGDKKVRENQMKRALDAHDAWLNARIFNTFEGSETIYTRELGEPNPEIYANKDYFNLTDEQRKYLEKYKEYLDRYDKLIPRNKRLNGRLPQRAEDASALSIPKRFGRLKDKVWKGLTIEGTGEAYEAGVMTEDGTPVQDIPVAYTNRINPKQLTKNSWGSLVSFTNSAIQYNARNELRGFAEFTKDVYKARKYESKGKSYASKWLNINETIPDAPNAGAASILVENFINRNFYGETRTDSKLDNKIDAFSSYVAINNLGLNVYAGVANVILGNALTRIEALAGQHFNQKELMAADAILMRNLPQLMGEIGQPRTTNKLRLILEHHNFLQDHKQRADGARIKDARYNKLMSSSALFFINHLGEYSVQSRTLLAKMMRTKLRTKEGKEINLWDAYDNVDANGIKTSKLTLREGLEFKNKNGEWVEFTQDHLIDVTLAAQKLNEKLHGIYSYEMQNAMSKTALGRAAMMFRKWFVPTWDRAMQSRKFDYELDDYTEGTYVTMWNFMRQLLKETHELKSFAATSKVWNNLEDWEKANIVRTAGNVGYFMGASVLFGIMKGLADDEDDDTYTKHTYNFIAYQALRFNTELWAITPSSIATLIQSPAAAVGSLDAITNIPASINMFYPIDKYLVGDEDAEFFKTYKGGDKKGEFKIAHVAARTVPPYKQFDGFFRPHDKLAFIYSNN